MTPLYSYSPLPLIQSSLCLYLPAIMSAKLRQPLGGGERADGMYRPKKNLMNVHGPQGNSTENSVLQHREQGSIVKSKEFSRVSPLGNHMFYLGPRKHSIFGSLYQPQRLLGPHVCSNLVY